MQYKSIFNSFHINGKHSIDQPFNSAYQSSPLKTQNGFFLYLKRVDLNFSKALLVLVRPSIVANLWTHGVRDGFVL